MRRHCEFGPHGEGTQGSTGWRCTGAGGVATMINTLVTFFRATQIGLSLRGIAKQREKASPVKPARQEQIGL